VELKAIIEAALLAAGRPVTLTELQNLFAEAERPEPQAFQEALVALAEDCRHHNRPVELKKVASGYRLQVREEFSPWLSKLFEERPARYSRAFLETLAIIAYRQPVTRGEIEDIRGVAVNSNIIKALLERGWVQSVGHKEVPGRPALLATTRQFLDYFNLTSLADLPPLREFIDRLDLALPPDTEPEPDDHPQATRHASPEETPLQPAQPTE
jgi:segregation and condensation protein B